MLRVEKKAALAAIEFLQEQLKDTREAGVLDNLKSGPDGGLDDPTPEFWLAHAIVAKWEHELAQLRTATKAHKAGIVEFRIRAHTEEN